MLHPFGGYRETLHQIEEEAEAGSGPHEASLGSFPFGRRNRVLVYSLCVLKGRKSGVNHCLVFFLVYLIGIQ
jgi:hypothetical protein